MPLAAAPERVFSGIRARTAAPVHYALVALIDPLPRLLSVQNPPPPDTAPNRIIYVPPIASTVSRAAVVALPLRHHRHRHRHRHPAPLSLLPSAPLPWGEVRGRAARSKEATSFDAMFTKMHTRARHRERARVRGGSTYTQVALVAPFPHLLTHTNARRVASSSLSCGPACASSSPGPSPARAHAH